MPPVSSACAAAAQALDSDPRVAPYVNASGAYSSAIVGALAPQCSNELVMNRTCHLAIHWTNLSQDITGFVGGFNSSVRAADPTARLCAANYDLLQQGAGSICEGPLGLAPCELVIEDYMLIALPGACRNADDLSKYVLWAGNPAKCAEMLARSCNISIAKDFPCL